MQLVYNELINMDAGKINDIIQKTIAFGEAAITAQASEEVETPVLFTVEDDVYICILP